MTGDDRAPGQAPTDEARVGFRVRFDEAGPDGLARASALLRYAQECAWVHSEALGFGREWYAERGLTWVVRCIELAVVGRAATGTRVEGSTRVTGFRRVWARRRTDVRGATGTLVAVVETDWAMIDAVRGLPARVPDEFPAAFGVKPSSYEPHRVRLPPTPASAVSIAFAVRPHELDPLEHANHAVYLDWFEEAALGSPDGRAVLASVPRTYRLEYAAPATLGRALVGSAWIIDEPSAPRGIAYRLATDGQDLLRGTVFRGLPRRAPAPGIGAR